jgi:hypothetical protein
MWETYNFRASSGGRQRVSPPPPREPRPPGGHCKALLTRQAQNQGDQPRSGAVPKVSSRSVLDFLSARKSDLKKGFPHLVLVLVLLVVCTRVKKRF